MAVRSVKNYRVFVDEGRFRHIAFVFTRVSLHRHGPALFKTCETFITEKLTITVYKLLCEQRQHLNNNNSDYEMILWALAS